MLNRLAAAAAPITLLLAVPSVALAQAVASLQVAPQTVEVGVGVVKTRTSLPMVKRWVK